MMKKPGHCLVLLAFLFSACTAPGATPAPKSPTPTPAASAPETLDYRSAAQPVEARVDNLLAHMSTADKIGQMTQVEKNSLSPADVRNYRIGSVLSGAGRSPAKNTPQEWFAMVEGYQEAAMSTPLAIPLIYGVDAVHGHNNLLNATIFPHNIGLGAANDAGLMVRIAQATAEEMLATGIPWNFAPVVAVPQDVRWGRTYEGYSENTDMVTRLGMAYIEGMQAFPSGTPPIEGQSYFAAATAKHFIGDGGTTWGSSKSNGMGRQYMLDQGDMQMDEAAMRALFLPPYKAAVQAWVRAVMVSFSSWNGVKMHAQKHLITDVLKGELGFDGLVVSDWQAVDQINPGDLYASTVTAINAGIDMVMVPYDYKTFIANMEKAVQKGDIPQARIDDAVRRILRVKFELGLFEHPMPDAAAFQASIRSPEHLALARLAVQKSLVLLKNENHSLPLAKDSALVFVAGQGAGSLNKQLGGWTINWQGDKGANTAGTSIYAAIQAAVGPSTKVVLDESAAFNDQVDAAGKPLLADAGIVVVGEFPYAEGVGDSASLGLPPEDAAAIQAMRAHARKVIVIILSGRPLIISALLPQAEAWVAAWLPGSEGAGVTDVLFGDQPFSGKLPYTWPRSAAQLPLNVNNIGGKTGCDGPLFPFGYGLRASDPSPQIQQCAP
jgi:beta-glucosidase